MTTSHQHERSGFKANDKVVCVDDTVQRLDLAHAPDGLLIRGGVYCVTGVSECGGVLLSGLRALSPSTGKEVGFQPSRFMTLEQFRLKFPKGVSSITTGDDDADYLDAFEAEPRRPIEFPEIDGLEEPAPLVHRCVEILEELYVEFHEQEGPPPWLQSGYWPDQSMEQVQTELRALLRSPHRAAYMNQSVMFWHGLLRNGRSTVLFCRSRSPIANLLFQMCLGCGNIFREEILDGALAERDFPKLTVTAGRLSRAPIRICDAREPDVFLRVLFDAHKVFKYALCDWVLEGEEAAAAFRMTADSPITFLCPQQKPGEDADRVGAWSDDQLEQ